MACEHPTIHEDHLISLIDGKPYRILKRHLLKHGFTPETYRAHFGLPDDYPMIPAEFARRRSIQVRNIDHPHHWDPNTNMPLSQRRSLDATYTGRPEKRQRAKAAAN